MVGGQSLAEDRHCGERRLITSLLEVARHPSGKIPVTSYPVRRQGLDFRTTPRTCCPESVPRRTARLLRPGPPPRPPESAWPGTVLDSRLRCVSNRSRASRANRDFGSLVTRDSSLKRASSSRESLILRVDIVIQRGTQFPDHFLGTSNSTTLCGKPPGRCS